jgi:DNA (cytosine-5)-methyltransferase 1
MLFTQIVRILKLRRPRGFLLENVPGLLRCDEGRALDTILASLQTAGYRVWHESLNTRCLTAQNRTRVYFVGIRDHSEESKDNRPHGAFQFPFVPDLGLRAQDILIPDEDFDGDSHYTLSAERWQRVQQGTWWRRHGAAGLVWGDRLCRAIIAHYGKSIGSDTTQLAPRPPPHRPRLFTPRECARLQGFPNSYGFPARDEIRDEALYRMVGNAVCPPIIAALAGAILAHTQDEERFIAAGLTAALRLALNALSPERARDILARPLQAHVDVGDGGEAPAALRDWLAKS